MFYTSGLSLIESTDLCRKGLVQLSTSFAIEVVKSVWFVDPVNSLVVNLCDWRLGSISQGLCRTVKEGGTWLMRKVPGGCYWFSERRFKFWVSIWRESHLVRSFDDWGGFPDDKGLNVDLRGLNSVEGEHWFIWLFMRMLWSDLLYRTNLISRYGCIMNRSVYELHNGLYFQTLWGGVFLVLWFLRLGLFRRQFGHRGGSKTLRF